MKQEDQLKENALNMKAQCGEEIAEAYINIYKLRAKLLRQYKRAKRNFFELSGIEVER